MKRNIFIAMMAISMIFITSCDKFFNQDENKVKVEDCNCGENANLTIKSIENIDQNNPIFQNYLNSDNCYDLSINTAKNASDITVISYNEIETITLQYKTSNNNKTKVLSINYFPEEDIFINTFIYSSKTLNGTIIHEFRNFDNNLITTINEDENGNIIVYSAKKNVEEKIDSCMKSTMAEVLGDNIQHNPAGWLEFFQNPPVFVAKYVVICTAQVALASRKD